MENLTDQAIVAAVLLVVGKLIKGLLVDDGLYRYIPTILVILGTPLYVGLTEDWSNLLIWCQGLLISASAVGVHQLVKQTSGKDI